MLKNLLIPFQLLYGSLKLTTSSSSSYSYPTPSLSLPPIKPLSQITSPPLLLSARHLFDDIPLSSFLLFLLMDEPLNNAASFTHDYNNNNNNSITSEDCPDTVSCTTFNILAPIYKRVNHAGRRESEFRERWMSRNRSILDRLLQLNSSIICLQEFWVGNRDLVGMYEKRLDDAGYQIYTLARTNNRGDGLLTALHRSQFRVLNYRELMFNDIGDRVAQVLHVELHHQSFRSSSGNIFKEALIVNTHLIFPHNFRYCFLRLQQVYKILQYIKSYVDKHELPPMPVILCGDWNGSKNGHVYKFLRSQGFVSTYDMVHQHADETDGRQKWVSHLNHRGNICGVDFIWLLNPQGFQRPLKESFLEAVLGNVKNLLQKASTLEDCEMTEILKLKSSCITYSELSQALTELGISGHPCGGLSDQDVKDLWDCIDTDRDGVADVTQYLRVCNLCSPFQQNGNKLGNVESTDRERSASPSVALGFTVKKAELFPPEAERGMWPENYSLSDHAHLTVDFCPVKMHFK